MRATSVGFGKAITWHSPALSFVRRTAGFGVMEKTSVSIGCFPTQ